MGQNPVKVGRVAILGCAAMIIAVVSCSRKPEPPPIERKAHDLCAACHAYPPPDSFPRSAWPKEVLQGYEFARELRPDLPRPPIADVVEYYQSRAPQDWPLPAIENTAGPPAVDFERSGDAAGVGDYALSNVNLVHLFDDKHVEVLACDMRQNVVKFMRPSDPQPKWQVLAELPNPVHTEVVDLDGDGIKDVLVACLGDFVPNDRRCGKVVWLRGDKSGKFTPITLLENVGRAADVRAADFNGDGKLDLIVGVFGWRRTGEIILLENQTTDWSKPKFVPHVIDPRHGTIHVPVADLNGDGKPDFVALISQEHETVVAFINEGNFKFRQEVIYAAPHPAWGSSGIELVDLDGDGRLDVLYTNGDSMDTSMIRPEHGVHWLRNEGKYPFTHQRLTTLYGAHRAVAADFTGKGRKDVLAVSFLPRGVFPQQKEMDSIVLLEQVERGKFVRHSLERGTCEHVTCAAGDLYGTGRIDFVTGHFNLQTTTGDSVSIWRNHGRTK
jgi:hypothetical protein